jgi:hypothetical protein
MNPLSEFNRAIEFLLYIHGATLQRRRGHSGLSLARPREAR